MRSSFLTSLAGLLVAATLGAGPAKAASTDVFYVAETKTAVIWFIGQIIQGDFERIKRTIDGVPSDYTKIILLDSPGGSVDEGILIGRYINQIKIPTMVPVGPGCHSACTFIFLAGRDSQTGQPQRIMVSGAKVGFHQAKYTLPDGTYSKSDMEGIQTASQNTVAKVQTYFNDINASPEFLRLFLSAPASDLTYMTDFEALRLGIYVMDIEGNRVMSPEEFAKR